MHDTGHERYSRFGTCRAAPGKRKNRVSASTRPKRSFVINLNRLVPEHLTPIRPREWTDFGTGAFVTFAFTEQQELRLQEKLQPPD
jgi:hypothetical protein